jgi:hypothetical protein
MDAAQGQAYPYTLIDAGVDWLTATAPAEDEWLPFQRECEQLLNDVRAAGGDVQPATLRDYVGHRSDGVFIGSRRTDNICVLSGAHAPAHWQSIAQTAANCSRLDLQATVWTHGEQPEIARKQYHRLKALPPSRGRPRSLTLIQSHPQGETLNVGKRQSDNYGRVYDWSSAHKAGEARTVWRYEVEFKREAARGRVRAVLAASNHRSSAAHQVHHWFSQRKVELPWLIEEGCLQDSPSLAPPARDPLAWFRNSVSKTIAREVKRHGIEAVLSALGLSDMVTPRKESTTYGTTSTDRPLQVVSDRRDSRPDNREPVSLQRRSKR